METYMRVLSGLDQAMVHEKTAKILEETGVRVETDLGRDYLKKAGAEIDENTKVVPGHGPISNKAQLQTYVSMLTAVRDNVSRLMQKGNTMEEVIAAKPTRAFDEKWGKGFLPPDQFVKLVYMDLSPKLP